MSSRRAVLYVGWALALAGCQAIAPPPARQTARPAPAKDAVPAAPVFPAGFDVLRVGVGDPQGAGHAAQVTAARADLSRMRVRVITAPVERTQWPHADQVARQHVALAAINGGYFDEHNRPLGLVISDGKVTNRLRRADWGVFEVRAGKAQVVHTKKFAGTSGVEQALQCGPRLVAGGQPTKLKESEPDERAAVGVDDQGRVLLAATTRGRLSLSAFAAVLARPVASGGLGCRDATNLDGGPSAQLCIPGAADLRGVYGMPTHLIVEERTASDR